MAGKRKCIVCGQGYDYCPNCPSDDSRPRWMFLFDSKNCNDIWEEFNAYRTGAKDATQAEKALRQLDLSKENDFDPVWKDLLAKIRSEAEPEREEPKRYKHEFNREKDKKK